MFNWDKLFKSWQSYIDSMQEMNDHRLSQFKDLARRVEALGPKPIPKALEKELIKFSEVTEYGQLCDELFKEANRIIDNKRNEASWRKGIAELVRVKRADPKLPVTFHEVKDNKSRGMQDAEA